MRDLSNSLRVVMALAMALVASMGCQQGTIGDTIGADARLPGPDASVGLVDASGSAPDAPVSPPDAYVPPPPDAYVPPPPTCDELYGAALEYILCTQTETTCLFNARTNGGNCNQMCAMFGGACVNAYDNTSDPGAECLAVLATGDTCATTRSTEICECTR